MSKLEKLESILGSFYMPIEVDVLDSNQFLKVRETLTRIGIESKDENGNKMLWQSCHILHKQGSYYITHFKHLFVLDGRVKQTKIDDSDMDRLLYVARLLQSWNLINVKDQIDLEDVKTNLRIIRYDDKENWVLKAKYNMNKRKEAK